MQAYDEQSLAQNDANQPDMRAIYLPDVLAAIAQLKQTLIEIGEATELFGQLCGDGIASAIATIEQVFVDELF